MWRYTGYGGGGVARASDESEAAHGAAMVTATHFASEAFTVAVSCRCWGGPRTVGYGHVRRSCSRGRWMQRRMSGGAATRRVGAVPARWAPSASDMVGSDAAQWHGTGASRPYKAALAAL